MRLKTKAKYLVISLSKEGKDTCNKMSNKLKKRNFLKAFYAQLIDCLYPIHSLSKFQSYFLKN